MRAASSVPVIAVAAAAARCDRRAAGALAAIVAAAAAMPAALAIASGAIVGHLTTLRGAGWSRSAGYLLGAAGVLGALFLAQQVLPGLSRVLAEALGRTLTRRVSGRVMQSLGTPAGLEFPEDPGTAELLAAINGQVMSSDLRESVVGVAELGIARGGALLAALVLAGYRWWVALVLLASYGYAMTLVSRSYQRQLVAGDGAPAGLARVLYLKSVVSTAGPAKEVRVFGLEGWLLGLYDSEWLRALRAIRSDRRGAGRASALSAVVVLAGQAITFGLLTLSFMHGSVSAGQFTTYALASIGSAALLIATPDLVHVALGGAQLEAARTLEDKAAAAGQPGGTSPVRPYRSVTFEDVSFRYPRSDRWVLRGLSLTIEAGASHAIVGVNGAGKTTLVKLLCGLYQPTQGRILVDGTDLRDLDLRQWQQSCAALFQDWLRLGLPLRDNVRLADSAPSAAELDQVAGAVGLDEVIAGLPAGWETVLSREFDGVDLSGGQWQRVGLARALSAVADGARLLLLDEPTAALDVRGETELFDRLLAAAPDTTIVLVSHRFSTVRRAERIFVLADGRVSEQGSHDSLLAADGEYASMFAVQASRYAEGEVPS